MNYPQIERLINIIATLRGENGCPWDREQTHYSLKKNMIEEAYEAVDAIEDADSKHLKEELGDVLLQVVLHSQIAKESNEFDIEDVVIGVPSEYTEQEKKIIQFIGKMCGCENVIGSRFSTPCRGAVRTSCNSKNRGRLHRSRQ